MRKRKAGHMSVQRGKRVLVHLLDGTKLVRKFKEHSDRSVEFMDGSTLATKDIATLSIYKAGDAIPSDDSN